MRVAILQRLPLSRRDHQACTWLYCRFALSYPYVDEIMAERGVTISYERIRVLPSEFVPLADGSAIRAPCTTT